ncbi:hypothetical protein D3C75_736640 [compost metagenome]
MGEPVDSMQEIGGEGAGNIGEHHTDGLCAFIDQTAGDCIGLVADFFDGLVYFLSRFVRVSA